MSNDTPSFRITPRVPGETEDQHRFRVLENIAEAVLGRLDGVTSRLQAMEVSQSNAIANCARRDSDIERHNEEIAELRKAVEGSKTSRQPSQKKTWVDVATSPQAFMAASMVVMLIFFIVYVSAQTGRDAKSFNPIHYESQLK